MTKAKKFGAFAGVFTPSILTILGVIMYMRLGWVVGQAGLINTIIIIVLAHVISLSTGLSISSIATDKKIKAGGIYYILSRSLGLPMGGAIGITLFVGTALSISLYLIGFAESFLSIEPIRLFLGLEQNIFGYQVVGTAAILILVAIALISTSLAIKAQYYILGAIGLSLVSIFAGFYFYPEFRPTEVILGTAENGIPLEMVFAVFFPAVTGFTAGVAMSGDLKDPKKSIPFGTMTAIFVGFVIYIVLAIGIAFFVNRDLLLNDTNYIMKIAWFSPFVVAGIWGATLSSALGGILGGPRILQAMATDRISPRLFARGHGINNEPRNALILIFVIAEAGILIGELNVVAGVVSMFYLASYGFINISYFLESWASADFRPSFKINRYIGLIGFIAAFGVMFKLNMGYMFAALIIMLGIYFILKRKQLKLDYGDVWHSVWSSLIRTALEKMDNMEQVERNWQPNIILFSGATKKRPHLIELGKSMVGRHGMLSNFDLVENPHSAVLFPKNKQSLPGVLSESGVFTRRQTVNDIYEGIDMIARTYGFSGLEPNTIMMGWAWQTQKPLRFTQLLKTLYNLDFNVLLLGYDKRYGYGDYKTIDIWFRDKSNIGTLALNLSKLLLLSDKWENAAIRVLVVNSNNDRSDALYLRLQSFMETMRVDGQLRIINNQIEQRPFYEIVEEESHQTSLVFLNIPAFEPQNADAFITDTNDLLEKIGTVVLLKASSSFKKIKFCEIGKPSSEVSTSEDSEMPEMNLPESNFPINPEVAIPFKNLSDNLQSNSIDYVNKSIFTVMSHRLDHVHQFSELVEKTFAVLENKLDKLEGHAQNQLLAQLQSGLLVRFGKYIEDQQKEAKIEMDELLLEGLQKFYEGLSSAFQDMPVLLTIHLRPNDFLRIDDSKFNDRSFKFFLQTFFAKKIKSNGMAYRLLFSKLIHSYIPRGLYSDFIAHFEKFGQSNIHYIYALQKVLYTSVDSLSYIEKSNDDSSVDTQTIIADSKISILNQLGDLSQKLIQSRNQLREQFMSSVLLTLNDICSGLDKVPANSWIKPMKKRKEKESRKLLLDMPGSWELNQKTLLRHLLTETELMLFGYRLSRIFKNQLKEIKLVLDSRVIKAVDDVQNFVLEIENTKQAGHQPEIDPETPLLKWNEESFILEIHRIRDRAMKQVKALLNNLPERVELFSEQAINELTNIQFNQPEIVEVHVGRLVDFVIQSTLTAPLHAALSEMLKSTGYLMGKLNDTSRLIRLSLTTEINEQNQLLHAAYDDSQISMDTPIEKVKSIRDDLQIAQQQFHSDMDRKLRKVHDELHLLRLIKTRDRGAFAQSSLEASQKIQAIGTMLKVVREYLEKKGAGFWHSESKARLFAQRIAGDEAESGSLMDRILNMKDQVSPLPDVWKNIPFYYQQLFIGKYNYQPEFFFGRKDELKEISRAISRYKAGFHGALLIHGEPLSGKTFFAEYAIRKFLPQQQMFTLQTPLEGSTSKAGFEKVLHEACGKDGTTHDILHSLPRQSVIFIDDLELWWEKSETGLEVIHYIFELIKKYNSRLIFVVCLNSSAFEVIRKQISIDFLFIQTQALKPLNSGELEELILFRHRTSGFGLQIKKSGFRGIRLSAQARIFNRLFRFSGGNSGVALHAWIASITGFKDEEIRVKPVRNVDVEIFESLSSEIKIVLFQLAMHKRASADKIQRTSLLSGNEVNEILDFLNRCGLICRVAGQVYEMDTYLLPHVNKFLLSSFDKPGKAE